ncbi:MAG: hypothetical protein KAH77_01505, partial [Thiomargarita sp.]|nr:hypothetical protein [Thiomargarita sp.]
IHTNGMDYEKFTDIVGMLDWVGLDIKAPKNKYDMVTGIENSYHDVHHVLKYLVKHKTMDYEIRTTLARDLNRDDIINLATELKQGGVKSLVLQRVTDVTRNYNSMLTAAQSIISNTFLR